jgi:bacterioferritin
MSMKIHRPLAVASSRRAKQETTSMPTPGELSPTLELRERARQRVMEGAVTANYHMQPAGLIEMLNRALATELVCVLRYKRHYHVAKGLKARPAAAEFLEHATAEAEHGDRIAERIMQLGGEPDFDPRTLAERSHAEYHSGTQLTEMITENLVAERIAIESYREMVQFIGDRDPTTRRMLEDILAAEEEHADDLVNLLEGDATS